MKKLIIIIFLIQLGLANAQTCCTSGTPLLGSLEMSVTNKNSLQINFNFNYNSLTDIYDRDIRLNDNTRERITQSAILEFNYGLTHEITLTTLFSYVKQERTISPVSGIKNTLVTKGFGDIIMLVKYNFIQQNIISKNDFSAGIGLKIPAGKSGIKQNNILLPADLQPGTGSWDIIFWGFYSRSNIFSMPVNLISNLSYKLNGNNKRFGVQFGDYKFGNEFIATNGIIYFADKIFTPTFFLRIRNTSNDKFSGGNIPNTGGWWFYAVPGLNISLSDNIIVRADSQIPVYRYLNGIQLTTTLTGSLSLIYHINTKRSPNI